MGCVPRTQLVRVRYRPGGEKAEAKILVQSAWQVHSSGVLIVILRESHSFCESTPRNCFIFVTVYPAAPWQSSAQNNPRRLHR